MIRGWMEVWSPAAGNGDEAADYKANRIAAVVGNGDVMVFGRRDGRDVEWWVFDVE